MYQSSHVYTESAKYTKPFGTLAVDGWAVTFGTSSGS